MLVAFFFGVYRIRLSREKARVSCARNVDSYFTNDPALVVIVNFNAYGVHSSFHFSETQESRFHKRITTPVDAAFHRMGFAKKKSAPEAGSHCTHTDTTHTKKKFVKMTSVVPPRHGQRVKSCTLPPFNSGNALKVVRLADAEGSATLGVVERQGKRTSDIWLGTAFRTTQLPTSSLEFIEVPQVPSRAYEEVEATIGGIGKHVRWRMIFSSKKNTGHTVLCVSGIQDRGAFERFVAEKLRPFGLCHFEYGRDAHMWSVDVEVPDSTRLGIVASALHCAGYNATVRDVDIESLPKLALERFDRSEHMWWNQNLEKAGPLRDMHRWSYDFIPESWNVIPFTWKALCSNIDLDPLTESFHLPLPLRDWFLTRHIDEANDEATRNVLLQMRGKPSVTCRLSLAQNRQLLTAAYWSTVAPFDPLIVEVCRLIRFRYMLFGHTSREIGGYDQKARYLGHGASIRKFKNKPQYRRENLKTEVLNSIYRSDGSLQGSGFKGTRGKYGHPSFPRYEPRRRMSRTEDQERQMRTGKADVFSEYKESCREG